MSGAEVLLRAAGVIRDPSRARAPSGARWVTKTDIASWYRCPYAWWLLDTGQITFEESVSEFAMSLITAGNGYQDLVEQEATPIVISPEDLAGLLQTEVTILGAPLHENKRLKLRGTPDGIQVATAVSRS